MTDRDIIRVAEPAVEVRFLGYGSHWEYAGKRYSYDPTIPGERERYQLRRRVETSFFFLGYPILGGLIGWWAGDPLGGFLAGSGLIAFCVAMGLALICVVGTGRLAERWWNRGQIRPATDPES